MFAYILKKSTYWYCYEKVFDSWISWNRLAVTLLTHWFASRFSSHLKRLLIKTLNSRFFVVNQNNRRNFTLRSTAWERLDEMSWSFVSILVKYDFSAHFLFILLSSFDLVPSKAPSGSLPLIVLIYRTKRSHVFYNLPH